MDEIPVTPSATPAPDRGVRRRGAAEEKMSSRITVPLAEEDEAVVLLEQDGAYSWVFPQDQPDGGRRRSSVAAGVGKSRTFEINLAGQGRPARRSTIIGEFLLGRARALVFRFVARVVADGAMAFLERNVKSGLVTMRGDPLEWHPKPPAALEATRTRLHILLFIHGTFSSTRGSFGALGLTEGGKALLERAAAKYDQVIGFDHPTLSVDPRHNADDLVAALEQISGGHPLHIDVVSYSRGGLVYRALAQRLAARREISFGRICFIAVPNAGTTLAESKNWRQLADLYTNVAMAGLRLLQFLPGAVSASLVAKETIKSVGAFVRYLTSYAIDEMAVPGLAAMRPHGTFLESLAASGASEEFRCVVISSFEAPALSDDDVAGLPRQILTTVADGVIDQLLGSDNDLVVNTASMTDFGQECRARSTIRSTSG
jgi:pimeloyl-ACP methyl ester carboxylesterase